MHDEMMQMSGDELEATNGGDWVSIGASAVGVGLAVAGCAATGGTLCVAGAAAAVFGLEWSIWSHLTSY